MNLREFERDGYQVSACLCECHATPRVMHCFPCCNVCYKIYIVEGKVDQDLLDAALDSVVQSWKAKGVKTT